MTYDERLLKMWESLMDDFGVSEEAIELVTNINGYNEQAMYDILYCSAGENVFPWEDEDEDEDED